MVARPKRSSALLIVDRTLKDRDLAGHFSSEIREEKWKERRKTWWSWYGQRRHDLDAVFKARYCADGSALPNFQEMEAVARAMAFHLQAYEGSERMRFSLEEWFEAVIPCGLRMLGDEPDLDEITADVSHRRRDITAISAGQLLRVTWEERCRLRLRTIRPCDLTPAEFRVAAQQRKREQDRDRARRTRRRQRKPERAEYRWQSEREPWLYLGVSRKTWFRRKAIGTLCSLVSNCSIDVPDWLTSFCRHHDLRVAEAHIDAALRRDTSASRLDEVSESADALVSPVEATSLEESDGGGEAQVETAKASLTPPFRKAANDSDIEGKARGEAGERSGRDPRCPPRVATGASQKEQAA